MNPESNNIEYKQSWRDEYLKWICGFANAQGGKIFIGIDDKGNIVGVDDYKKLMDDIPNKAVNHLGLVVDVNLLKKENKYCIEINVPTSTVPVSFHGIYHYRSGSTKQELKGAALREFLLKKMGKSWEALACEGATIDDLNIPTIKNFVTMAVTENRIPKAALKENPIQILKRVDLITPEGQLTNAAVLLFGKTPGMVSATSRFKIGRFGTSSHDLLYQDLVETNIFEMPDKVMEILETKYLIRPIHYEGIIRKEPLEYPEKALREAVLNSIIHKDYSSTWVFLRVYDDHLHIWNPGLLPEELTIEKLKKDHLSYPRNKRIADVFYRSGNIEHWGRGTNKIIDETIAAGLPEPIIEEDQGGIKITFWKDIYTEDNLKGMGINMRQVNALLYIKKNGEISNTIYQTINKISKAVATTDLSELLNRTLIQKVGTTGKGTKYILPSKGL